MQRRLVRASGRSMMRTGLQIADPVQARLIAMGLYS